MNKSKQKHIAQSTTIAQSTIDTILTQGGNRLYDRYIQTKIPKNVRNTFEKVIQNVFNPMIEHQDQEQQGINDIHQSLVQKINVADQKKKTLSNFESEGRSLAFGYSKTIQVDKRVKRKVEIKDTVKKKCHQRKRQLKEPSKCVPFQSNYDWFEKDVQLGQKWTERQQRLNEQMQQEQELRKTNQKSARLKKQLENQLRQLQENNKTITFNHHTGRIFHLDEHHQYRKEGGKFHLINLQFGFTDEKNTSNEIKQSLIRSSRKITSFQRNRRKINFIDEDTDQFNYNNNGKRQTTNIPFIEVQEGVNFIQGKNIGTIQNQNTPRKSRINSASLTHRTFKSYTREKMESCKFYRTIATATSATKTRYMNKGEADQKKLQNEMKSSILWSKRGEIKNHKITKNSQLVGTFFDWVEQ